MGIAVLGPLAVGDADLHLNPRDRVVLSALAMRTGEALTAEQLADALWADAPPASWSKNLQSCIVRLRKVLGAGAIETTPHGYRLALPPDQVDAAAFERLVSRGRELLVLQEPERAAYHLESALALWRGPPLQDLEDWEAGTREARRLAALHRDAEDWWLEARLACGGHRTTVPVADHMVHAEPTRERRWQMLALSQYRSGMQVDALATIRRAKATLVDELGLDPGPELAALEQAILHHEPGLLVPAEPHHDDQHCPYPGLTSYDVADAESFFGRDAAVTAALDSLRQRGVLVVVGPSGCGKSSLVRAGVVACLLREGRRIVVVTPGQHPLQALSDGLGPRRTVSPILVVDQAEESFTLCEDSQEREAFWQAVARHRVEGLVVVAMRADRMGDVAAQPDLARLVEEGLFLLGGMSPRELEQAVVEPAHQVGLVVERGLVDLLVREVEDEPGALPLMGHALRETWRRREGWSLTVAGYQASGGIRDAVAQSAEGVYTGIRADQRAAMRNLMLRLVLPGPGGDAVRTRLPRRLVVTDRASDGLVDALVEARLLTSETDVVTLAHEALVRSWPRLRGWLEDDAEGQRILHHLSGASDAWETLGRPESELYRGLRLTQALEWAAGPHPELTPAELEFLSASRALAQRERLETAERAQAQTRMIRRLRVALAGAAALLALTIVTSGLALWQREVAQQRGADAHAAAVRAQASALEAVAGRAGARALSTDDVDTSLLLAATGARLHESPATRGNLIDALGRHPQLVGSVAMGGTAIAGLATSPDGDEVAVLERQGRVRLVDLRTREISADFRPRPAPDARERVAPLAFHPDGEVLAVGLPILSERPVRLLDARTLEPKAVRLPGTTRPGAEQHDRALSLDFNADGTRLAGTFHRIGLQEWPDDDPTWEVMSASLMVWDTSRARHPRLLSRVQLNGRTFEFVDRDLVAMSPDGTRVFTSRPLTAYDADSGRRLWTSPHTGYTVDLSPDGRLVALDDAPDVLLVDAATGRVRHTLRGHTEDVWALRFSPDGRLLASASDDRTATLWRTATGEAQERLELGESNVQGLAFTPDSRRLISGGADRALRLWDVTGRSTYISQLLPPGELGFGWVIPAHDGRTTAHMVAEHGTFFLDTGTGRRTRFVGPPQGFSDGSWSRDGDRFISVAGPRVQVWTRRGRPVADNDDSPLDGRGYDLDYTGDETGIVVTEEDGTVSLLDAETLRPMGRPVEFDERVCCVSGGPGGHTALVLVGGPPTPAHNSFEFMALPDTWALLDLARGAVTARGEVADAWHAEISPDGSTAAIGTGDGAVTFVDLASGEPRAPAVQAHETPCCWLSWSPDGSTVAGSAWDGWVSLWDGGSGQLTGRARLPEVEAASVEFLPDGHTLSIATYADAVYRWDTGLDSALDHACARAGRNFTRIEWQAHFPGHPYLATCTRSQLDGLRSGTPRTPSD